MFLLWVFFLHGNKYSPQQLTYAVARGNQILYVVARGKYIKYAIAKGNYFMEAVARGKYIMYETTSSIAKGK